MNTITKMLILPIAGAFFAFSPIVASASAPTTARDAVTHLAKAPQGPLPQGTSVRDITIANGLATIDFSKQLKQNFHGGDTGEANAVNAILETMGQFPNVRRVQILMEGHKIESLGGLLVISQPLAVIRSYTFDGRVAQR